MTTVQIHGEPFTITHWLVRDDEPYNGRTQSFLLPDGTIAYSGGLTPEAYAIDRGFPVRVITDAELDRLEAEYIAGRITVPEEETEAEFWDALEVLPPCRWHTRGGVELFHISERITGNLVDWHAQTGGRFFHFVDLDNAKSEDLARKVAEAARTICEPQIPIRPIEDGPEGFELCTIDLRTIFARNWPTVEFNAQEHPYGKFDRATAWARAHPEESDKMQIIPLRKDGDWSGTLHTIPARYVKPAAPRT
ncbi:MAG: hypothetical protein RI571_06550 [Roseovarius sp.]|nr:hypothetical protein [Roseovarius sp.]